MRAVARQPALEQDEALDRKRRRGERAAALEEVVRADTLLTAIAGDRDMGMEGAVLGLDAGGLAGAITLAASAATGWAGSTPAQIAPPFR